MTVTRTQSANQKELRQIQNVQVPIKQFERNSSQDQKLQKLAKIKDIVSMNHERLQRIFVYYCSFGEPLNTNTLRSTKFIKLLRDARLLPSIETKSSNSDRPRSNMSLSKPNEPMITMVQADLLFKKHTGLNKNSKAGFNRNTMTSSFTLDQKKKEQQKEIVSGLNRMNFNTFVLALSDIANQVYAKFLDSVDETAFRGEAQAFLTLVNNNLVFLDNQIQKTEKGNSS